MCRPKVIALMVEPNFTLSAPYLNFLLVELPLIALLLANIQILFPQHLINYRTISHPH